MMSCKQHPACMLLFRKGGRIKLHDIYRVYLGKRQGQHIWVVDGARVVQELYPAFIMGGNDQRYRFNPENEIWIDNRIAAEELEYTIAHELIERKLMRERLWSYDRAHVEGGLAVEHRLRLRQQQRASGKEKATSHVLTGEHDEAPGLGGLVPLTGVYRQLYKKVDGLAVWIVDGSVVRRNINGDFCFGGHDLKYRFVPKGEIWLDAAMTVEEMLFTLTHELTERMLMARGLSYDDAYPEALVAQLNERRRQAERARRHEKRLNPVPFGTRHRGTRNTS